MSDLTTQLLIAAAQADKEGRHLYAALMRLASKSVEDWSYRLNLSTVAVADLARDFGVRERPDVDNLIRYLGCVSDQPPEIDRQSVDKPPRENDPGARAGITQGGAHV